MSDIKSKLTTLLRPGDERCGFVTARGRIVEVQNIAEDPSKAFKISPKDILKWTEEKGAVATWHTHPEGDSNLSGEDYACFLSWDGLVHYVVGTDGVTKYFVDDGLVIQE